MGDLTGLYANATSFALINASTSNADTEDLLDTVVATTGRLNEVVLTQDIIMGGALVIGFGISLIGQRMPMLFGGNFMLAFFFGVLMKTSQERDSSLSQWVFWPIIIWISVFAVLSF